MRLQAIGARMLTKTSARIFPSSWRKIGLMAISLFMFPILVSTRYLDMYVSKTFSALHPWSVVARTYLQSNLEVLFSSSSSMLYVKERLP
jgi:hypothetical protein